MNHAEIATHLVAQGFNATLTNADKELVAEFTAGGRTVTLTHTFPSGIGRLPLFYLMDSPSYGILAHVLHANEGNLGTVCVQDIDSISANFEMPEFAYEESLRRHITLLTRLIEDPAWNRQERIREFHSNWDLLCEKAKLDNPFLFCASDTDPPFELQVRQPYNKRDLGIKGNYIALAPQQQADKHFEIIRARVRWVNRPAVGKAVMLPLRNVEPAPFALGELAEWYVDALAHLDPSANSTLARFRKHPAKLFWLVFRAPTTTGNTDFAIRFSQKRKAKLPTSVAECDGWLIEPISVRSLNRDALVPRGGGDIEFSTKSVLLVGCGSVGSEVAHRLAAAGLGKLTIADSDRFHEDNLYRHTLSVPDISKLKCVAVAEQLALKFPWIEVTASEDRLENWCDEKRLSEFDLVIVAIGAPTLERAFHAGLEKRGVKSNILNTWVEAYGVGGHATLDIEGSAGCLRCAYVDPEKLIRGMASNLNFLAPNQNVTVTHAGCGNQFMPYNGIASSYTATMAADLASQYLQGSLTESSKISWKGSANEAKLHGFKTSYRNDNFSDNLQVLPLLNHECDVCCG